MNQESIDRLQELAKIKKERSFTTEENAEYRVLSTEYVASIKANLHQQLRQTGIKRKTDLEQES